MKKTLHFAWFTTLLVTFSVPLLAVAQMDLTKITQYKTGFVDLINQVFVPALMAIAFFVFLWGVYKYFIWGAENELEKAEGRKFTLWGITGFVVILYLWALVSLLRGTCGLNTDAGAPNPPTIRGGT